MKSELVRILTSVRGRKSLVVALCVLINLLVLLGIAFRNGDYLSDYRLNENPDARHYVELGRNFLLEGRYTRMGEPPWMPGVTIKYDKCLVCHSSLLSE